MTEAWRRVFRSGIIPLLSTTGLNGLQRSLIEDDPRLTQGSTTSPPPLQCVLNCELEGGCVITLAGWHEGVADTVGEAEEYFAKICFEADQRLGEPAAVRYFLNWFDDTPRDEMRRELLSEIDLALFQRVTVGEVATACIS